VQVNQPEIKASGTHQFPFYAYDDNFWGENINHKLIVGPVGYGANLVGGYTQS
jgi:hypothetical protein